MNRNIYNNIFPRENDFDQLGIETLIWYVFTCGSFHWADVVSVYLKTNTNVTARYEPS